MNNYNFSARSLRNLGGVHGDLQKVAARALELTEIDFMVIEGLRTEDRQRDLMAKGATKTMNSRHLTGHAIDVAAWVGEIRWDWALYDKIAVAFKQAAKELNVDLEWGGDWKSFKDGPHFQLSWSKYPIGKNNKNEYCEDDKKLSKKSGKA